MPRNSNKTGLMALMGLGLYYAYRNRFKIQQYLESKGIDTRLDRGNVQDMMRSGVAKLKGSVQHRVDQAQHKIQDVSEKSQRAA